MAGVREQMRQRYIAKLEDDREGLEAEVESLRCRVRYLDAEISELRDPKAPPGTGTIDIDDMRKLAERTDLYELHMGGKQRNLGTAIHDLTEEVAILRGQVKRVRHQRDRLWQDLEDLRGDRDRLTEVLHIARRTIEEGGGGGVTCTVWVPRDVSPSETLVDFLDAAVTGSPQSEREPQVRSCAVVSRRWWKFEGGVISG